MTDTVFRCGRYEEESGGLFKFDPPHEREDGTCSYCGSISEAKFFECVEAGCTIVPTDKNYKAYVDMPDPRAGTLYVSSASSADDCPPGYIAAEPETMIASGWGSDTWKWMRLSPRGETKTDKFYFQHLSPEGRTKFVSMLNAQVVQLGHPGHFYVLPYFIGYKQD